MKRKIGSIDITAKELKAICKEYEYDEEAHLLLDEGEDERPFLIKKAMSKLEKSDFVIFCLYMEYKSERKVASVLNCSRTPIHNELVKITQRIKELL